MSADPQSNLQRIADELAGYSCSIVAVSKGHPADAIQTLVEAGHLDFGENRVDELRHKRGALHNLLGSERASQIRWHFIGALQSRKAKDLGALHRLHSLDSTSALKALGKLEHRVDALVQVNLEGERHKRGVAPDELLSYCELAKDVSNVRLRGLMCLPPWEADPAQNRARFARLRGLRDACLTAGFSSVRELSMGMSRDRLIAAEEGSDWVRVGTAIFGSRGG